ncbi:MAG: EthD domain-containing protein [bacterium]|nr:EthD domain-containing protein [bacterium]
MRLLSHLTARKGAETDFDSALRAEVSRMRSAASEAIEAIHCMIRLDNDLFGACAPYRGTVEIQAGAASRGEVQALASGLANRFGDLIHADLSTALLGRDVVFIEPKRTAVRYQYLMRRNVDFDHEAYLERYASIHSQFGLKTPGIHGYVQLHLDLNASKTAAERAGVGIWQVDSVSELYLESVEAFMDAIGNLENDGGARVDEEIFVDRACSHDFTSHVDWQD